MNVGNLSVFPAFGHGQFIAAVVEFVFRVAFDPVAAEGVEVAEG